MPDIQNFFHEALAVIMAISSYFPGKKAFSEFYQAYHFPVVHSLLVEVMQNYFHPNFHLTKMQRYTLFVLHRFERYLNIIQWGKAWYDFPVVTVSHYRE